MSELDKSKQAHVSIFMFLRINGQSIRPFLSETTSLGMGSQKMRDLTYFDSAASGEMLKAIAAQMSHLLIVYINTYYTQQREVEYANYTISDLVRSLSTIFGDSDKSVLELAEAADKVFRFKNEGSAAVPVATMASVS